MKIWVIAWKDMTVRLRDRRGFLMMILLPLLLTLILGAALSGVFNEDAQSMPDMNVAVVNADTGELGKTFVEQVLQSDELKPHVTLQKPASADAAQQLVQDGKADVAVVIPSGFSDDILQGGTAKLDVLQDPGKSTIAQIMRSIAKTYTDRISTVSSATSTVIADLSQTVGKNQDPAAIPAFAAAAQSVASDLRQVASNPKTGVQSEPVGSKPVSGKQYYAVAMAVMFLLFNASVGAKSILDERAGETLSRMLSTPTGKGTILLGKYFGTLGFSVLQFAVLLAATRLLFGIDWGGNLAQILAVGVLYAVAVSGLAMLAAAVLKTPQAADAVGGIGIQVLSLLGGSMFPLSAFPDALRTVAFCTPNAWALSSFLDIMAGTTWAALLAPAGVLLAIGAVSLTVGTWRLSAR